jgi:D-alanine-D-alanine ligase
MKRLRVALLYGGRSGEHEVSLASAAAVWANLERKRYEPVAIRIEKDGRWVLADRPPSAASAAEVIQQTKSDAARLRGGREVLLAPRPGDPTLLVLDRRPGAEDAAPAALASLDVDVVFPVLHGPLGEDGTIQGLLELANLPYVGSGVLASAVGMDKLLMKTVFRAHGLQVPEWIGVTRREWLADPGSVADRVTAALQYPVFVKPANMGSSVGISKVTSPDGLAEAMNQAAEFDRRIVVETGVAEAREIECSVLGNEMAEASQPGEIVPSREFYDYEAKYIDSGSRTVIPAELDRATSENIRRMAVRAFQAIDGAGLARVDFLLSRATGALYLNEINTMPGFTTISMFSKMWAASGVDYPTLVNRLVTLALERHAEKQEFKTSLFT